VAKVGYVIPVTTNPGRVRRISDLLQGVAQPGTEVKVVDLDGAPSDLEHHADEHKAVGMLLEKLPPRQHEFDALVIGCFYDPGIREMRERFSIPVVGVGESSMHIASCIASRFSIIVPRAKVISKMKDNALLNGFSHKIVSWRCLDVTVEQLHEDPLVFVERIISEGRAAIEQDLAEALLLGCTAIEGISGQVQEELGVPVLDPVVAGFKYGEMLADVSAKLGWSTSKIYDYEWAK